MSFDVGVATLGISSPLDGLIGGAAYTYGVDAALIKALISQESSWYVRAYRAEPRINDASYGLMQLLLATARGMRPGTTADDLYDPAINIDLGTRYLASQIARFGLPDAISAYNAGHPISGNQLSYVAPVLAYQAWFQANDPQFGSGATNPPMPPSPGPVGAPGGTGSRPSSPEASSPVPRTCPPSRPIQDSRPSNPTRAVIVFSHPLVWTWGLRWGPSC